MSRWIPAIMIGMVVLFQTKHAAAETENYPPTPPPIVAATPTPETNYSHPQASPGDLEREKNMTREVRIRAHQEKIDRIIQDNRRKQEEGEQEARMTRLSLEAQSLPAGAGEPGKKPLGRFAGIYEQKRHDTVATTSAPGPLITVSVSDVPVLRAAEQISQKAGVSVRVRGDAASERVSIIVKDAPLEQVLGVVVAGVPNGVWRKTDSGYELTDKGTLQREKQEVAWMPPIYSDSDTSVSGSFGDAPIERVLDELSHGRVERWRGALDLGSLFP